MLRPTDLKFGASPCSWVRSGCLLCLWGGLTATVGALSILAGLVGESHPVSLTVVGILCLAFGCLLLRLGADAVRRCEEKKVILAEHELRVPACGAFVSVAYREIDRVWLDEVNDQVLIVKAGDLFDPHEIPTNYFASAEEVSRFIEELRKRIKPSE
jgi:hypothetical protein